MGEKRSSVAPHRGTTASSRPQSARWACSTWPCTTCRRRACCWPGSPSPVPPATASPGLPWQVGDGPFPLSPREGWGREGGGGTNALPPPPPAGQERRKVELDARQTSHVLGGLQPGTDYVVTVAPLFGQLEGPAASVRQRTGTGWALPLPLVLLASSRSRDEGTGWHSPTGSVCRGGRGADAADQHPGPHGHPGALGRPPRGPRLPPGVEKSHRLGSGRPVPDVTLGRWRHTVTPPSSPQDRSPPGRCRCPAVSAATS